MKSGKSHLDGERVVWVFTPADSAACFPAGVWSTKEKATQWIRDVGAAGCLSAYILDESAYESNVRLGLLKVVEPAKITPEFKRRFTTAVDHSHVVA